MPANPRTSILLPTYDAAATLTACLSSVARQRDDDWECLIVDDGSRDASLKIARRFETADARFRVVATPHRGLVPALMEGLAHCRGRYVARMDADDWMHRDRLQSQVRQLEQDASLVGVGCRVRLFPRRHLATGMRAYEAWLNSIETPDDVRNEAFVECPIAHPSLLIRRDTLLAFGYRDCAWPEDYDLVLRLLAAGKSLAVVPRRLLGWRVGDDRLSRTHGRYAISQFTDCKAEHLTQTFLADTSRYTLWGYGGTGRALARALRARARQPSAILELHPGRVGNTIAGAPVIHPDAWLDDPRGPLLVSVAGVAARGEIRAALAQRGLRETIDYVCAA